MAGINPIQLQKYLKGMDYPARKADLLKRAEQNGADDQVRSTLEQLPDQEFDSAADVSKALPKHARVREPRPRRSSTSTAPKEEIE